MTAKDWRMRVRKVKERPPKKYLMVLGSILFLGILGIALIFFLEQPQRVARKKAELGQSVRVSEPEKLEKPLLRRISDRIRAGESLSAALIRHSVASHEIFNLANALHEKLDLKTIRPGDVFVLEQGPADEPQKGEPVGRPLEAFELIRSDGQGVPIRYRVSRNTNAATADQPYSFSRIETPVTTHIATLTGKVETSLYEAILHAGGDPGVVDRFAEVFGWQIDFYREAQENDVFKMVIESRHAEGRFIGYGRVLAAEYDNMGRKYRGFYFASEDGKFAGLFDEKGNSLENAFLKSPMELARITSRYGQRFHPVLKRQKKHNGIDYGASTGTPFWSVAEGVVLEARYSVTAGRMIRIRHRGGYLSEYFHASRIASGVVAGAHVRQKQVIGYVGSTGMATGPHLHFGMKKDDRYVDPTKQNFRSGNPVPPRHLNGFLGKIRPLLEKLEHLDSQTS